MFTLLHISPFLVHIPGPHYLQGNEEKLKESKAGSEDCL